MLFILQNKEMEETATVVKHPHVKITTKITNYIKTI